jgi:uncharacterized protein (DUF305 family)
MATLISSRRTTIGTRRGNTAPRGRGAALLLAVLAAASCAPAAAQQAATSTVQPAQADADARFIQMMIPHHQQALEMAALVPERTQRDDLRLMAERITVSQQDEIATMERWLQARGQAAPAADAHAGHGAGGHAAAGHAHMPGMATPEEMARLAALRGPEFDRRFLELMIRHHEGALAMVAELFASPAGGQSSEIYQIASDVDADQRMEIDRMRMLMDGPRTSPR